MPLDGNFLHDSPPPNTELQPSFWERLETPSKRPFLGGAPTPQLCTISSSFSDPHSSTRQNLEAEHGRLALFSWLLGTHLTRNVPSFSFQFTSCWGLSFLWGAICLPTSLRQFCRFSRWWVCKCLVHSISLRIVATCVCVLWLNCVWLFVTPWTVAYQAALSMHCC